MYLRELSGSKFHSVTSSIVFCTMMIKTQFTSKVDLSCFGNELFNYDYNNIEDQKKNLDKDSNIT